MTEKDKIEAVEKFIFNDEVQNVLSEINNNVMDFNILEITGMGTQEIKHSNILGWLFDDREHNLEYQILDGFLKKIVQEKGNECNELHEYIYLANKKRDITIYLEKDNIDLLIVDEINKTVITIENKVDASERVEIANCDAEELGQLACYEKRINTKYKDENKWKKYFIFLTINLEKPSTSTWLKASHQMVSEVINNILETKEITMKTKIVLGSYVDLLKRNGIVEDQKLKALCEKIWMKKDYEEALDIIGKYRVTQIKRVFNLLKTHLKYKNKYDIELEGIEKLYKKFKLNESEQIFEVQVTYNNSKDEILIGYFYPKLEEQKENVQKICGDILPKQNTSSSPILKINKKYVGDKDIGAVVNEILNKIKKIDENIIRKLK